MRVPTSSKKIAFPVPRYSAVINLIGSVTNRHFILNGACGSTSSCLSPSLSHHATAPQMRQQLLLQDASRLHIQAAIDCFVRNRHGNVTWILSAQPARNLLRGPLLSQFSRNQLPKTTAARELAKLWPTSFAPGPALCHLRAVRHATAVALNFATDC